METTTPEINNQAKQPISILGCILINPGYHTITITQPTMDTTQL